MMAHKHLHELLKEEQEPFLLKNYIADRLPLFNKPIPKNRAVAERSNSMRSLCNQACFFSIVGSPDVGKSPFADFPAAGRSPCKPPNAALLHEAIMRIQKQSCSSKSETRIRSVGSGLFGSIDSILKRLGGKNRSRRWEKVRENSEGVSGKSAFEMGFACDCSNSRRNSTVWSERSDEMFLELETSCSSFKSEDSEERESAAEERENGGLGFYEKHFYTSPYRLALEKGPSVGRRPANLSSPAASPSRNDKEEICEVQKIHVGEEEEEKEQSSPVSVLDPPFEDDEEDPRVVGDDENGFDLECSYAIIERAKQQLLHKLRRFEKLAELDPVELEKRMLEEQENEGGNEEVEDCENDSDRFVREVLSKSGFQFRKVPVDVKRLALDLLAEEEEEERGESGNDEREAVAKRVCKRLESWRDVKPNTIDMMVELAGWKRNDKELVGETTGEIELAIFGLLVEELSEELCHFKLI